jgi:methionyl-tRNA formyltransferase
MLIVFAYEFPHQKTHDGLVSLVTNGNVPDLVVGAPFRKLKQSSSTGFRVTPQAMRFPPLSKLCKALGLEYIISDHDSEMLLGILEKLKPKIGLILGARILRSDLIKHFELGIVNAHPGLLPQNRGLDNIKWAVHDSLPQGITFHLIDKHIDRGKFIRFAPVEIFEDDTWLDLHTRNMNLQISLMPSIIDQVIHKGGSLVDLSQGKYNRQMSTNEETIALARFPDYKLNYPEILKKFDVRLDF